MIALPGPFGWDGYGIAISLRCRNTVDGAALTGILAQFSSYAPAHRKILASMHHCGRYDCIVSSGWFKAQHWQLGCMLAAIGVDLIWEGST